MNHVDPGQVKAFGDSTANRIVSDGDHCLPAWIVADAFKRPDNRDSQQAASLPLRIIVKDHYDSASRVLKRADDHFGVAAGPITQTSAVRLMWRPFDSGWSG